MAILGRPNLNAWLLNKDYFEVRDPELTKYAQRIALMRRMIIITGVAMLVYGALHADGQFGIPSN
jgi:hypothetical protein